jgi:hypothetical protein
MSFWAKNAKTTTIRIGKAALLKNLLMREKCGPGRAVTQSLGLPSVASPWSLARQHSSAVHPFNAAT